MSSSADATGAWDLSFAVLEGGRTWFSLCNRLEMSSWLSCLSASCKTTGLDFADIGLIVCVVPRSLRRAAASDPSLDDTVFFPNIAPRPA